MTKKQKLIAIENLLDRYYKAAININYWQEKLDKVKEEFTKLVIEGKSK